MKKFGSALLISIVVCIAIFSGTAFGEIKAGAINMSHMIGGYAFDGKQDLEDGFTYMGALGYQLTNRWGLELAFNYMDTKTEGLPDNNDVDGYIVKLDALYHFMPENRLVPYLAAGMGGIFYNGYDDDSFETDMQSPLIGWGAGLKYFLTDAIALRGDLRHLYSFDDRANNLAATFGVTFMMGGVSKEVEPVDSDGDGVFDDIDQCPDTPPGTPVDSVGCPEKAMEPAKAVEPGTRETPQPPEEPGKVTEKPAEKTVKEPEEPAVKEKITMKMLVEFDFDKSFIRKMYHTRLKHFADFMKQHPEATATIEGHTDSIGTDGYNIRLSKKRSEAVRDYLVNEFGIDASRFELKWFGESRPIADNKTADGRQRNRRAVTISIVQK